MLTIVTFIFFTGLVAAVTWWRCRNRPLDTDTDFFLAGRSLSGVVIAGSLLLTNLSTEQLVGLNASAFSDGLSVMAWEVIAGCSLVVLALFFLPRYLKSGIATIPEFLGNRYDHRVRAVVSAVFIVAYMLILLPFVLYMGATGLMGILDLHGFFPAETSELTMIWSIIIFIAIVGGGYAIFGGLRAIAVSDSLNGLGLLLGGLLITFLALRLVAGEDGSIGSAFAKIKAHDPDAFQSLGKMDEDVSWPTLFTGVLLLNFFYWCTNQQIIQRTFGAKNLAEGQKGVLLAAFFKILAPLILVLPGIIAAYLVATDAEFAEKVADKSNRAYGALVSVVLPDWLVGFFAAVVVGSILSTFNSVLNASATLFSLDVVKRFLYPSASTRSIVLFGQICSFVVAVFAVIAAPLIFHGKEGVFGFFQKLNSVYFIPLLAVILVGMFNRTVNASSALLTLALGFAAMSVGTFFNGQQFNESGDRVVDGWLLDWLHSSYHYMGIVFVGLVLFQLLLGKMGMSRETPYIQLETRAVDLTPWKAAPLVGTILIVSVIGIYVAFALI